MKLQLLISTMKSSENILDSINVNSDAIVVNQLSQIDNAHTLMHRGYEIRWINSIDKGLSKSRNLAINSATADYVLLADDDMTYTDHYAQTVCDAFMRYPDADILVFNVIEHKNKLNKLDPGKKIGYIQSLRISSVMIALKLNNIRECQLNFDERFGSGSQYTMGEENIFIFDCLRAGLTIRYSGETIGVLRQGESSWFRGYTKAYFIARGAGYKRMSKHLYVMLILQFAFRKYKIYKNEYSLLGAVADMLAGAKEIGG